MDTYNLLIIDNDPNIRGLLNELLAGRPEFGILIAADGREAARQLVANRIDIILADIHMPGFTGLELMASLTTLPMKPEILVMTANTTPEDIETARRIGARGMVQKPFDDLEKVEMQINKALEAARAMHHPVLSPASDASAVKAPDGAPKPPLWPAPKNNPTPTATGQTAAAPKGQPWPTPKAAAPSAVSATPRPIEPAPKGTFSQVSAAAHGPAVQATKPAAHPVPPPAAAAQSRQEVGRPAGQDMAPEEPIPDLPPDIEAIFRTASSFDTRKMRMQVPIVCLQTWEEKRAIASLRRQAAALHREFYVWTAARGLLRDASQSMGEIYGDAVRALEFIRRQKGNGLYVLADFRPRLEDERVVRMLREMVMEQDSARQLLVLTAPQLQPPAEMAQVCAVFDWPAGEGADLEALYEEVVTEAAASAGRDVGLEPEARDALLKRVRGMPAGRARFEIARALLAATSGN